ncbi:MAG: hypothetical protein ABW252_11155 [Polyangiales bacterium]
MNRCSFRELSRSLAVVGLLLSACGDDDASTPDASIADAGVTVPSGIDAGQAAPTTPPLFAVRSQVISPEGVTTYVSLVSSLDEADLSLTNAVELNGYVTIDGRDGDLYVSDREQQKVTRYAVDTTGPKPTIREVGSVGLGAYAFVPDALTATRDANKVYLTNDGNPTLLKLDPARMSLAGELTLPNLTRPSFRSRSSRTLSNEQGVMRTFFFQHQQDTLYSEDTQVVWVDDATDTVKSVATEQRCPVLNKLSQDEQGNTYFSTWLYGAAIHLRGKGAATCALRMRAGQTVMDPDWKLDYAALTDGRGAAELSYVRNGKAILSVFHDERTTPADAEKSPYELAGTLNWRIWSVDLEANKAAPLEDIPWSAGDHLHFETDGRFFVFIPGSEWKETTIYEVLGDATSAVPRVTGRGWITKVVRLR